MSFSPALTLYRGAASVFGAFASAWLSARAREGKEDPARLGERFARYTQSRPAGTLIWLHAASVGESGVALGLIQAMAARDGGLTFLLSSGTRTSADLIARRLPPRTTHVYAPLDRADVVRRFLAYWRPDIGVFVESELWPNLILAAEARRVPLALVNARMSPKSLRRWQSWPQASARLLRAFAFVSAADARTAETLSAIRGANVPDLGNLKLAIDAPHLDAGAREALARQIGDRPLWLAASTHEGEDEIVLAAHARVRETLKNALLILVPRHPERGANVSTLAGNAPRRSRFDAIGAAPIYVADTLGELGLFYDLAPVALVAGSLLPELKGHNPIEPAKLGAAILTGPHVESFHDLYGDLSAAGGATIVENADAITANVLWLWNDAGARAKQIAAARSVVSRGAEAMTQTASQLMALLAPARQSEHAPA